MRRMQRPGFWLLLFCLIGPCAVRKDGTTEAVSSRTASDEAQKRGEDAPKVIRAVYTVEDITLEFDSKRNLNYTGIEDGKPHEHHEISFSVGILVVDFNRAVHVRRNFQSRRDASDSILYGDYYPEEEGESLFGLTQLRCAKDGITVPSYPPSSTIYQNSSSAGHIQDFLRSRLPRGVLLPHAHAERYDLAWLLATIALERHDENRRMHLGANYYEAEQDPHRRYVALFFGAQPGKEQSFRLDRLRSPDDIWHMARKDSGGCTITFLSESVQKVPGLPAGSLVSTTTAEDGVGGVAIKGEFPLDAVLPPFQPNDIIEHDDHRHIESSDALERAMERVEIAIAKHMHVSHLQSQSKSSAFDDFHPGPDCLPIPDTIANETKAISLLETQHELLGRSEESQEAQFIGMIKGPLESIMSPIMNPLGGVMSATVMDAAMPMSGGSLHDNLKYMHEQITASLIVSLTAKVPEIIGHIVPYEISSELAGSLRNRLTQFFLTDDMLPRAVGNAVIDLIADRIVKTVSRSTASRISELTTPPALHLLTRSISHAVVPTLVHVLTHNPLMDYYCYYCYHKKLYCSYCQYQPSQLYYAQYYTGYYSTYYSDYYTDWFKTPTASYREELMEEEQEEKEDGSYFYTNVPDVEKENTQGDFSIYQR